ncbi:cytochrome c oxidase cbb3-type subunit I/II [Paracoccus versutus]|uniref:Cytochrome c oxidase cbb3-type subunit I/II n=2 Tax=Paracoccus versutus TaxID=34007 RepID=A0AAQ0HDS0_PARVE|nr:cytochrome c oxidase cbb3-type subunit I/II [Paracoccus versutus]
MAMAPYDLLRTFGGALFLLGALICVANILTTFRQRRAREEVQDRPIHATMAAEERDAEAALQPGKLSMGLVAGIIVAASTGGIVEIAPLFTIQRTVEIPADLRR